MAFSPSGYNVAMVGKNVRIPTFLAFGGKDLKAGSRQVTKKKEKIIEYVFLSFLFTCEKYHYNLFILYIYMSTMNS